MLRYILTRLKSFNNVRDIYASFSSKVMSAGQEWRSHTCGELQLNHHEMNVTLCGWLQYNRGGKFFTLADRFGAIQCLVTSDSHKAKIEDIPNRSVLKVKGRVQARPKDQVNPRMGTGEVEVEVMDLQVVNPCTANLPFTVKDSKVRESLRMEHRVLDLARPTMMHNLLLRHQVTMDIVKHLWDQGFIHVDTPYLYGGTSGGAAEFKLQPGSSGHSYSLTQSPQIYKQLLMVAGYDRYFQLARCFRDEGTKPDRQPEFSQVDMEMSFTSMEQVKQVTEELIHAGWPSQLPPLDPAPFPRCSYAEAMELYGTDKPDLRYSIQIQDVTPQFSRLGLNFITSALETDGTAVRAVVIPRGSKNIKKADIEEFKTKYSPLLEELNLLEIQLRSDGSWKSPVAKLVSPEHQLEINSTLGAGPTDLVVVSAGPAAFVGRVLGNIRTFCADKLQAAGLKLYDPQSFQFLWVENFPMFQPGDQGELESPHHPFTAPLPEDLPLLYTDTPEKAVSQHYDLVLNGQEIAGGSIRIHDPQLQRHVLENILKLEPSPTFQALIEALECGAPPHGGIALGLDRLLAIMCGAPSIRDVLAFPKASDYSDPTSRRLEKEIRSHQTEQ